MTVSGQTVRAGRPPGSAGPAPVLCAGIMSGTSADGADVAFVRFSSVRGNVAYGFRGFFSAAYPPALRRRVLRMGEEAVVSKEEVARLSMALGDFYADALSKAMAVLGIRPGDVDVAGCHGQTVGHFPVKRPGHSRATGATLQIGEPSFIAQRTGITVVSDFRPADIAAGGEGAPLAPAFHALLLRGRGCFSSFQNVGGIGNVTVVSPSGQVMAAFDTGPGNMLLDGAARRLSGGKLAMDRDGRMARAGAVHERTLARLVRDDAFLRRPPPKSTGRERYGEERLSRIVEAAKGAGISGDDLMATLTAYTAEAIRIAFERFILPRWPVTEIVLGGGGRKNPALVSLLSRRLPGLALRSTETIGLPPQYVEAAAFAYLAYLALCRRAGNVPCATGAAPAVLGKISPGGPPTTSLPPRG